MRNVSRWLVVLAGLVLVGAACSEDASGPGDGEDVTVDRKSVV